MMRIVVPDKAPNKAHEDVRRRLRRDWSDPGVGGEELGGGRSEQEENGNNGMRSSETQHAELLNH